MPTQNHAFYLYDIKDPTVCRILFSFYFFQGRKKKLASYLIASTHYPKSFFRTHNGTKSILKEQSYDWTFRTHAIISRSITSRSWIQAIHKDRILLKNLLKNKDMVFENGVRNIQAAAYNGARTLYRYTYTRFKYMIKLMFHK